MRKIDNAHHGQLKSELMLRYSKSPLRLKAIALGMDDIPLLLALQDSATCIEVLDVTPAAIARSILKTCLQMEIVGATNDRTIKETAFVKNVNNLIVDTLHLELRLGEHLITALLRFIFSQDGEIGVKKHHLKECKNTINQSILRSVGGGVGNFGLKLGANDTVVRVSMNNDRQRKVIAKIGLMIDVICPDKDGLENSDWKRLFSSYEEIITVLRKDFEFTDDEINVLSDKISAWSERYVAKMGQEATTNYAHYMIAGIYTYISLHLFMY